MSGDRWFRNHTWTEEVRDAFLTRLERSRGEDSKAQYVRIQAVELHRGGGPEYANDALGLLDVFLQRWPDNSQLALVHEQRAECLRDLGREQEAITAYRDTFAAQRRRPNVLTNAHYEFAWWIASSGRGALFDEALEVTDEFSSDGITFPALVYLEQGARALISYARGKHQAAAEHARLALNAARAEHSGLRYHPDVGLVHVRDADVHALLEKIAAG